MVYTLRFFSLRNAVCFIILSYLVPVLFAFYIQGVLKLKKNNSGSKRLKTVKWFRIILEHFKLGLETAGFGRLCSELLAQAFRHSERRAVRLSAESSFTLPGVQQRCWSYKLSDYSRRRDEYPACSLALVGSEAKRVCCLLFQTPIYTKTSPASQLIIWQHSAEFKSSCFHHKQQSGHFAKCHSGFTVPTIEKSQTPFTFQSPVVTICTTSLTFNNSTFCPHTVFMCFVWISEQTAIVSLYSINWLVCITEI